MSSTITALTSGGGLAMAGDTSGQLELKTNNGTTALTLSTSQNATFASKIAASTSLAGYVGTFTNTNGATDSNGVLIKAGTTGSEYSLKVSNTSESYPALVVKGDGVILLGTTTTEGAGGITFSNASDSALYGKAIYNNSPYNGTRNAQYWAYNGSVVGYIQTSTSSTSYVTSSDYRLKEDIAPMTGALAKVALLKPCTYKWKLDGSDGQGFIAHELQEIVPDAVAGEKDAVDEDGKPQYQGVDTSFLVATLTAAIQELNAKVDAQALEIQALKGVA